MNCKICGEPVVLVPSAAERAAKYGGSAKDYIALFTTHAACFIEKRRREVGELMRRLTNEPAKR